MNALKEKFQKEILPQIMKKSKYKNIWQAPRLQKAVINVGLGIGTKDSKYIDIAEETLLRITGQKPIKTQARISISNFKVRKGQVIGLKVTLRGRRMYDFVDKIINVTLPRIRDFRGISIKTVDKNGNINIGFREHIAFPEIKSDEVEKIHGLQVTITTSAKSQEEGIELFKLLGFPFTK